MKKQVQIKETIPALLLLFLFCCCMMAVLLSGAKIYQRISANLDQQFSATTCVSYITAKARHYDTVGGITQKKLGQTDALAFLETIEGERYLTYLYCYQGNLMELFCAEDAALSPEDGEKIMPMEELRFHWEDDLLFLSCRAQAHTASTTICLQASETEALP